MGSNKYDVEEEKSLEQLFDNLQAHIEGLLEAVEEMKETYSALRAKAMKPTPVSERPPFVVSEE